MTMSYNPNEREIIRNMILLRKCNIKMMPLKYLKKPTNKIHLLIIKVESIQIEIFVSGLPNAWK